MSVPLAGDKYTEIREVIAPSAATKMFLDSQDIKLTMFHNREILLARSNKGKGTLKYKVDNHGVWFEFKAPHSDQGDRAIEAVRRGDIAGCSFTFVTDYRDTSKVAEDITHKNGKDVVTYTVKKCDAIIEFTLASDPAYPSTSVSAREQQRKAREKAQRLLNLREAKALRAVAESVDASPGQFCDLPAKPMSAREKDKQLAKDLRTIANLV